MKNRIRPIGNRIGMIWTSRLTYRTLTMTHSLLPVIKVKARVARLARERMYAIVVVRRITG